MKLLYKPNGMNKGRLEIFHNYFSTDHAWINKSWGTFFSLTRRSSVWWEKTTKVNEMLEEGRKWSMANNPLQMGSADIFSSSWMLTLVQFSLSFSFIAYAFNVCSIQENTDKSNVIKVTLMFNSLSFVEGLFCCLGLWLFLQCWTWISAVEMCSALSYVVLAYIVRSLIHLK